MNWNADESQNLKEDQIAYLKTNYDMNNVTQLDKYNLFCDLTQMNVISAEDCVRTKVQPIPFDGAGYIIKDFNCTHDYCTNNFLEQFDLEYKYYCDLYDCIGSAKFKNDNNFNDEQINKQRKIFSDNILCFSKLNNIFKKIS